MLGGQRTPLIKTYLRSYSKEVRKWAMQMTRKHSSWRDLQTQSLGVGLCLRYFQNSKKESELKGEWHKRKSEGIWEYFWLCRALWATGRTMSFSLNRMENHYMVMSHRVWLPWHLGGESNEVCWGTKHGRPEKERNEGWRQDFWFVQIEQCCH